MEQSNNRVVSSLHALVRVLGKWSVCFCVCEHTHTYTHTHARARSHTHTDSMTAMVPKGTMRPRDSLQAAPLFPLGAAGGEGWKWGGGGEREREREEKEKSETVGGEDAKLSHRFLERRVNPPPHTPASSSSAGLPCYSDIKVARGGGAGAGAGGGGGGGDGRERRLAAPGERRAHTRGGGVASPAYVQPHVHTDIGSNTKRQTKTSLVQQHLAPKRGGGGGGGGGSDGGGRPPRGLNGVSGASSAGAGRGTGDGGRGVGTGDVGRDVGTGNGGRGVGTGDGERGVDRQGGLAGGKDRGKHEGVELDPALRYDKIYYSPTTVPALPIEREKEREKFRVGNTFELDPAFLESLREFELSIETMTAA